MRNQPSVWREKREDKQLIHREELNGAADTNAKTLHGDGKFKKKPAIRSAKMMMVYCTRRSSTRAKNSVNQPRSFLFLDFSKSGVVLFCNICGH